MKEETTISTVLSRMYHLADLHDDALNNNDMESAEQILYVLKEAAESLMERTTPDWFDHAERDFLVEISNANFSFYSGENNEV